MASQSELLSLGGVLLILLGVVIYNLKQAKAAAETPERPQASWIAKFAHHEGSVVGETMAVDGERLILKQAGVFKAVPLSLARDAGDEVVLEGDIDWDQAIAAGTAWHETHTAGHDPDVTQQLTTSSDVRAPALEAFQKRYADEEE